MKTPKARSLILLAILSCIALTLALLHERVEEPEPEAGEDHAHAAEDLLERAILLEQQGKWDEAIRVHEEVIRDFGDDGHDHGHSHGGDEGYAAFAEESIRKIRCLKRRGPNFSAKTLSEIHTLVTASLSAGDLAALNRYAACGFVTGHMESDDISSDDPEKAVRQISRSAKEISWKPLPADAPPEGSVLVESQSGDMALVFSAEGLAWIWNGFLTRGPATE